MQLVFRQRALRRMFERGISPAEVESALAASVMIESYPDDTPYPSRLSLGLAGQRPIHVIHANVPGTDDCIVITVYEPNDVVWLSDWKTPSNSMTPWRPKP